VIAKAWRAGLVIKQLNNGNSDYILELHHTADSLLYALNITA